MELLLLSLMLSEPPQAPEPPQVPVVVPHDHPQPMPGPRVEPTAPKPVMTSRQELRYLPQFGGWVWVTVWGQAPATTPAVNTPAAPGVAAPAPFAGPPAGSTTPGGPTGARTAVGPSPRSPAADRSRRVIATIAPAGIGYGTDGCQT